MGRIIGLAILLLCVLLSQGFGAFAVAIKSFALGIFETFKGLFILLLKFPSELGLLDTVHSVIIYYFVLFIIIASGVYLTKRSKHVIWGIISSIVAAVSLLFTLSSSHK